MIRLLIDTGMRASELVNVRAEDLDLDLGAALVVGKGRRPRVCPFGSRVARDLDRCLRTRSRHAHASEPWLWLGKKGRMTDSGLRQMVQRRGEEAGLGHIHPHQLRHTFAHTWLAQGGGEGDLMRWPAGVAARCCSATVPRPPMSEPGRRIAACHPEIACDGAHVGDKAVEAHLT